MAVFAAGPARVSVVHQSKAVSPVLYSMFLETEINYGGEGVYFTTGGILFYFRFWPDAIRR